MKNWLLPIAVLGASGVGLLFATERGRARVHDFFDRLASPEEPLAQFQQALENELEYIQRTLDQLSEALEA